MQKKKNLWRFSPQGFSFATQHPPLKTGGFGSGRKVSTEQGSQRGRWSLLRTGAAGRLTPTLTAWLLCWAES